MVWWDEGRAMEEIRGLSLDARLLLQDRLRNGLQTILSFLECGDDFDVRNSILDLSDELRRMGL